MSLWRKSFINPLVVIISVSQGPFRGFEKNEDVTLQMVSIQGKAVYNRIIRIDNAGVGRVEISTPSITLGLYLIKANGKLIRDVKKVIISK